jgi:hypothetical protein
MPCPALCYRFSHPHTDKLHKSDISLDTTNSMLIY